MVKLPYILILLITAMILSSCTKSIFDNDDARCPFVDRGGCQSMESVNRMVKEKRYTPDGQFVQQAPNVRFIHYAHK